MHVAKVIWAAGLTRRCPCQSVQADLTPDLQMQIDGNSERVLLQRFGVEVFPSLFYVRGEETRPCHEARSLDKVHEILVRTLHCSACAVMTKCHARDSSWSLLRLGGGKWTLCRRTSRQQVSTGGPSACCACAKPPQAANLDILTLLANACDGDTTVGAGCRIEPGSSSSA